MYYLKVKYKNGIIKEVSLSEEEYWRIDRLSDKKTRVKAVTSKEGETIELDYRNINELIISIDSKDFPNGIRPGSIKI